MELEEPGGAEGRRRKVRPFGHWRVGRADHLSCVGRWMAGSGEGKREDGADIKKNI